MRFTSQPLSVPFSILYMFQLLFIELTMLRMRSASLTCLDACCCHGLRLPVFNKETTYLLTYLPLIPLRPCVLQFRSTFCCDQT